MFTGRKAGFCILWWGTHSLGTAANKYDLEVEFNIPDYATGNHAYIQMITYGVNLKYNHIFVNGNYLFGLRVNGNRRAFDSFLIEAKFLKKGKNTFKVTARDSSGKITGDVDDIQVTDPIIIYPVS